MSCTIREFTEKDRTCYVAFSEDFYQGDAVLHRVPITNFHNTFDACMTHSPYLRGFMLLRNDIPAGYALISLTWSNEAGGLCVLLEELYICAKHRGTGLGSSLIGYIEAQYKDKAKRIRLEVSEKNPDAMRLYQRLGYGFLDYLQMVKDF